MQSASRILLSTPQTLPAAATTVLDPVLAVTAVEAAAKAGRLVDLLGRPQPSLHTTGLPKELLPPVCVSVGMCVRVCVCAYVRHHRLQPRPSCFTLGHTPGWPPVHVACTMCMSSVLEVSCGAMRTKGVGQRSKGSEGLAWHH